MPQQLFYSILLYFFLRFSALPRIRSQDMSGPPFTLLISCGSVQDIEPPGSNVIWSKDRFFSGGSAANASVRSGYAPADFNTLRYFDVTDGPENCYNLTMPSGHYMIRIFFAYGQVDNSNKEPLYDISLEGTLVHSLKQGWSNTPDLSFAEFRAFITDGAATICFHSTGHGNPSVLSIEALQILDDAYGARQEDWRILKTVRRISCGSNDSQYGVEYNANIWGGDRFWATDKDLDTVSSISTPNSIEHASQAPNLVPEAVFQSASKTSPGRGLSYVLEVEQKNNYSLWLYFAEIDKDVSEPGQRVFDIVVNGNPIFKDFDIIGHAKKPYTAVILHAFVPVEGRFLTLSFIPHQGGILINGFEIFQVIQAEYNTVNEQVWALQSSKGTLGLPSRLGWNGDPCVPQEHPWNGIDCDFDYERKTWVIRGLDLDQQGIKGFLTNDISLLQQLHRLNFSGNAISGEIPQKIGDLRELEILDLSHNKLHGSIPGSLGNLTRLRKLFLNDNELDGEVPAVLGAGPIHGASFNFLGNPGLCGVPGLRSCRKSMSGGSVAAIVVSVVFVLLIGSLCGFVLYKRHQNIRRAQMLSTARDAPYAKSRTSVPRDVQMSRQNRERYVPHYMQHS